MNINGMKILSIDDNIKDLSIIEDYAGTLSLEIDSFQDPKKALLSTESIEYDVVVVNHKIPQLNGLDFIKTFRINNSDTPVIMLSDDVTLQEKALRLGAHDFLSKPVNALLFQARIFNALKLKKAQALLKDETLLFKNEIQEAKTAVEENEQEALYILGKAVEYKDRKTGAHTQRVAHYCQVLAKAAGLNEKVQDVVFHASQLHDLGNVGISDDILLKEGKLDEDEYAVMKTHARIGYDMLKYSQSGYLKAAAVICYSHHERYDGSGYPIGLSGETIPILGRIVAIADVFDALTQERPYKKAWTVEDACQLLIEEKEKHFDPNLVDLFIENMNQIKSIQNQFMDDK